MRSESSDRVRRLAGVSGLAGALLFFAGDMLFYGHFGPGAEFAEGMLSTSDASVAGTSLRWRFGWADCSLPVHSWILARVPQHSTLKPFS